MTKMTIVTDPQGNLVGAVHGHTLASKYGNLEAKVSFPENYKLHKVEVEDDVEKITDAAVFQQRLLKHLPKS
jgi:hypothetical protein